MLLNFLLTFVRPRHLNMQRRRSTLQSSFRSLDITGSLLYTPSKVPSPLRTAGIVYPTLLVGIHRQISSFGNPGNRHDSALRACTCALRPHLAEKETLAQSATFQPGSRPRREQTAAPKQSGSGPVAPTGSKARGGRACPNTESGFSMG